MKTTQIRIIVVVIALCLLLTSCMQLPTEEQPSQSNTGVAENDIAFCEVPASFDSTQELVSALKAGACETMNKTYSLQFIKQKMDSVYIPTVIPPGFVLYDIELNQYGIVYYYMPVEEKNRLHFSYETGIAIVYSLEVGNAFDPLQVIENQMGINRDEDGYVYLPSNNSIYFAPGNTWMSITVPDSMNNYDTLKSLCVVERVSIHAEVS